jgi:hypothetical protein
VQVDALANQLHERKHFLAALPRIFRSDRPCFYAEARCRFYFLGFVQRGRLLLSLIAALAGAQRRGCRLSTCRLQVHHHLKSGQLLCV